MNVGTLQQLPPIQASWKTVKAQEKEAEFLSLRLLNKRLRIRLSALPLDLNVLDGCGNYFATATSRGWFAAITRSIQNQNQVILSPLADLRSTIKASTSEGEEEFKPKRVLPLALSPTHIIFSLNDERLVVGFADGSISIYDTSKLFQPGTDFVTTLRVFAPAGPGPIRQIIANPGDLPELVALRREGENGGDGLAVEVLDLQSLQSKGGWRVGATDAIPTSIAWSPKGKQLAIGLRNGDVVTFSPSDTGNAKLRIPKPPQAGDSSIIFVLWLSNNDFYGIYVPPGSRSPDTVQKHVAISYDPRTNSAMQTELETPYYASPALRPPGAFPAVLRTWQPTKYLIFIADSTSSDIGVVGNIADTSTASETWWNLSLEETSTPSVPLDKDDNDTVPLALEIDVSFDKPAIEQSPPLPILYLYASDGTLQAWHIQNSVGGVYPGMSPVGLSSTSTDMNSMVISESSDGGKEALAPSTSAFGQTPTATSAFGSSGFGNPTSAFGQASALSSGTSAFGSFAQDAVQREPSKSPFAQTSAFGVPSFGQPSTPFGGASSSNTAFPQQSAIAPGFGAFASSSTPSFGQTGFGFGSTSSAAVSSSPAGDAEAVMSDAAEYDNGSKFGGLSLSADSGNKDSSGKAFNSMFGNFSKPSESTQGSSQSNASTSGTQSFGAFGSIQGSSFLKPATGFGAFSNYKPQTVETKSEEPKEAPKQSPAFGTSGFGVAKPTSAFGQPSFGQSAFGKPSFGQPAFGQPSFGTSGFGKPSFGNASSSLGSTANSSGAPSSTAGAFSAFAQGPSSFAQVAQSNRISEAPSVSMSTSSDTEKTTSPFGASQSTTSAFGNTKPTPAFSASTSSAIEQKPAANAFSVTPPASAFGLATQKTNVFSGGQLPPPPSTSASQFPTTPTPTPRTQTANSTPDTSPQAKPDKVDTLTQESPTNESKIPGSSIAPAQPGTPVASLSPFKSSSPAVTTGAFANLTTTPSGFKPAAGFGAFGSGMSNTSPFANPKPAPTSAFGGSGVSAFAPINSPQSSTGATTPTFGTPTKPGGSVFGQPSFGQPSFGQPSFGRPSLAVPSTPASTETTPIKPMNSAFSAYAGSGGFSAFTKAPKPASFSDLLKSQSDSAVSESTTSPSLKTEDTKAKGGKDKEEDDADAGKARGSSFVNVDVPPSLDDHDNLPPTPSSHGTFDDEEDVEDQVQVHDDADSFLSETFSETDGEDEDAEHEAEEAEITGINAPSSVTPGSTPKSGTTARATSPTKTPETTPSKAAVNKLATPSPAVEAKNTSVFSALLTPKSDESPSTSFNSSPSPSGRPFSAFGNPATATTPPGNLSSQSLASTSSIPTVTTSSLPSKPLFAAAGQSTTPPGSPDKNPVSESSVFAPKPATPAASSVFGLGIGHPSSRPTKSSPLAGAPTTGDTAPSNAGITKPRPASPKTPFGQFPAPVIQQEPTLPRTSPAPNASQFSTPSTLLPSSTAPNKAPPLSAMSLPPITPKPAQGFPDFVAARSSATPTPLVAGNAPFIMPPSSTPLPIAKPLFGAGPAKSGPLPTGNLFGPGPKLGQQSVPTAPPTPAQPKFDSSMQSECYSVCAAVQKDLEDLRNQSESAVVLRERLGTPSATTHSREDLSDKTRWTFGDLDTLSKLLKNIEKDILVAYKFKNEIGPTLQEIESDMLKAETKKEEVIRLSKAKTDPEISDLLKRRALGPDTVETQSQMRTQVKLVIDRVEQLEMHLKECKKKIENQKKGKVSMQAPSLDTINRTYANIDAAIAMQNAQIAQLTARIAKLDVVALDKVLHETASPRSRRTSKRHSLMSNSSHTNGDGSRDEDVVWNGQALFKPEPTPSIPASTAAALNAERSALRLKNALAAIRTRPLLNTQAVEPVTRTPTLDNMQKPRSGMMLPSNPLWPPVEESPSSPSLSELSRQGYMRSQQSRHSKPIPLGKRHERVPSAVTSFDWGPLPGVKPMTTLSSDVRPEMRKSS